MPSPPLDNNTRSNDVGFGTDERRRAWHDITSLGLHARSDDVGCGMTSPPMDSTHDRQCRAWHAISALGLAYTVGQRQAWYAIIALGRQTRSNNVGVSCHHLLWTAHTVEQRQACHDITAFGQQTRSNNVGHEMPSPPSYCTIGRTTSGVTCHHRLWVAQTIEQRQA